MAFRDHQADDVKAARDNDGPGIETWTWSPASGVEKTVKVHVVRGGDLVVIDPGQGDIATVRFQTADIDVDGPRPKDKAYDASGNEWTVTTPGPVLSAAQWKVTMVKRQRIRP